MNDMPELLPLTKRRGFQDDAPEIRRARGAAGGAVQRAKAAQRPKPRVLFVTGAWRGRQGTLLSRHGNSVRVMLDDGAVVQPRNTSIRVIPSPWDVSSGLAAHAAMPAGRQIVKLHDDMTPEEAEAEKQRMRVKEWHRRQRIKEGMARAREAALRAQA